jgi:hypothetical protein
MILDTALMVIIEVTVELFFCPDAGEAAERDPGPEADGDL